MKHAIKTDKAPAAIGPYSQAVSAGGFIFVSGQLPLDPTTAKLIDGDMTAKTEQILYNLKAVLDEAGAGLEDIVKTTIFLTDLGNFAEVNQAYGSFFKTAPPARSTVQVAALPLAADIEIEAVAILRRG